MGSDFFVILVDIQIAVISLIVIYIHLPSVKFWLHIPPDLQNVLY